MRKMTFVRPVSWSITFLCLAALWMILPPAFAQDNPSPSAMVSPSSHRRIDLADGVALKMLVKHPMPDYPQEAIEKGIQGLVVLKVLIGVDGHIVDLHIVHGPAIFSKLASDSVRKWVYKPYLVNNEPVEVDTKVNVVFSLDNHRASVSAAAFAH